MSQAASKKVLCEAIVSPDATQYYGRLVISRIRFADDSPVTIQEFLSVVLKLPRSDQGIGVDSEPWTIITPDINTKPIDEQTIAVTARIVYSHSHTFDIEKEILIFAINGNLADRPDFYTASVELYADDSPSGTVQVTCPAAPDTALASFQQTVHLNPGRKAIDLLAPLGATTPFSVPSGTYAVTADELTTPEQTVVATAQVSPDKVTVQTHEDIPINVTCDLVGKYSALDIIIGVLSPPVDKEEFHVKVIERSTNNTIADFFSASNHTNKLRRLPSSGTVYINVQIILNNIRYYATKSRYLSNNLIQVSVGQADIRKERVDSSYFVGLPVKVDTPIQSHQAISVCLRSMDKNVVYTQMIKAQRGTQKFTVPVAPQKYTVQAKSIIDKGTVYAVNAPATLEVENDGSTNLRLKTQRGANLNVHGFPNFLSFGGFSDLVDISGSDFVAARASSVFNYAGNDGAGDPDVYLSDDPATVKTIQLASNIENQLSHHQQGYYQQVLPIMVSYTCNLSLGDIVEQLQDKQRLTHGFANLILSLKLAKAYGKQDVPAGYIVNPYFLGECQKGSIDKDYEMPVLEPLQRALEHWAVEADIPASIIDTLYGYVLGVNWLFRTIAKEVTFGWQVNLWGVGSSDWIYSTEPDEDGPAEMARKTADYIKSLKVYDSEYKPDFIAIDRYEGDDFTQRANANGYCYGPNEWGRYFDYSGTMSLETQVPVCPWQIPASRIPHASEKVINTEMEHWGTGGSYILSDSDVNSDYHNIHPTILRIKPSSLTGADTVEDIFVRSQPFDLTYPKYEDFLHRGIFSVQFGGGSTTGIVSSIGTTSSWTQARLNAYMDNRIPIFHTRPKL
ncbi:MAG: hypothetical protein Q9167_003241 [Letrouitia subvulpina]